jgi:hypothetical protein
VRQKHFGKFTTDKYGYGSKLQLPIRNYDFSNTIAMADTHEIDSKTETRLLPRPGTDQSQANPLVPAAHHLRAQLPSNPSRPAFSSRYASDIAYEIFKEHRAIPRANILAVNLLRILRKTQSRRPSPPPRLQ